MTLPTLVAKHQKQVLITKMKYTYAVLNEALLRAQQDYGDPTTWDWGTGVDKNNVERVAKTYISPYLSKVSEGFSKNSNRHYVIVLKNGITLALRLDGSWDTSKGEDGAKEAVVTDLYILVSMKNKTSDLIATDRDYSREDFILNFKRHNKRITFFHWGGDTRNGMKNSSIYACNKSIAKNYRLNCGALIFYDGWEIKDDYPW